MLPRSCLYDSSPDLKNKIWTITGHAEGVRHSVKEEPSALSGCDAASLAVPNAPPPPAPKKRPKAAVPLPHSMAFAVAAVACHIAGGSADFYQKDQQHHHTQKKMRFASHTRSGGTSSSSVKDEPHDADNSGAHTSCDAHAAAMPTITELAPAAMHKGLLPIGANQNLKSRVPRPPAGPPPRSLLLAPPAPTPTESGPFLTFGDVGLMFRTSSLGAQW